MPSHHRLKVSPENFKAACDGNLVYLYRKDDSDFKINDKVMLIEAIGDLATGSEIGPFEIIAPIMKDSRGCLLNFKPPVDKGDDLELKSHPLYEPFMGAIRQAMYGKGERHGGAVTPFFDQSWKRLADSYGVGFLAGQSSKKLEESLGKPDFKSFEAEILGATVYMGMVYLQMKERFSEKEDGNVPRGTIAREDQCSQKKQE